MTIQSRASRELKPRVEQKPSYWMKSSLQRRTSRPRSGKEDLDLFIMESFPMDKRWQSRLLMGLHGKEIRSSLTRVDVLSRVHHKNPVGLVGYCRGQRQMLLYEYMHSGSLFDHLHGKPANAVGTLDWKTRLQIGVHAAKGLEYLHTGCSPSFIHRDAKRSNILLTLRYDAKVADFGLTKLIAEADKSKVSTMVMGTPGYLDPEYYITQQVSSKSDVYSFGVVLLELLTGRLPISNISERVRERLQLGDIDSILDPAVRASNPNLEAVWRVADVAMRCVEPKSMHRLSMSEVLRELLGAAAVEGTPSRPP